MGFYAILDDIILWDLKSVHREKADQGDPGAIREKWAVLEEVLVIFSSHAEITKQVETIKVTMNLCSLRETEENRRVYINLL